MSTKSYQMIELIDSNNTHSSEELIPSSTNQKQQENTSVDSSFKPVRSSRNVRHRPKTKRNHQSNSTLTTHQLGDWVIRESLEPFPQNKIFSNKSNIHQWNIDDVCLFFEHVLSNNSYTPIIKEHLIDGIALLLLKEEHLANIFQMESASRIKLLNRIKKLKTNDVSEL